MVALRAWSSRQAAGADGASGGVRGVTSRRALSYFFMSPLTGLRVLDFSHALAGPYCTMLLAQYGAEILKIEDPAGGDVGRSWGPPFTGDEASYFLGLNLGQRSLAIAIKQPA